MRKNSCLTLALIMVVMAALCSVGFIQAGAVESASYTFTRAEHDIVLDGAVTEGEEWDKVEWTALHKTLGEEREGFSARFKGLWKEVNGEKYVYFFLEVTDPTVSKRTDWQGDAFFVILNENGTHKNTSTTVMKTVSNATTGGMEVTYSSIDTRASDSLFRAEGRFRVTNETFFFDLLVQDNYEGLEKDDTAGKAKYSRYAWNNVPQNNVVPIGVGTIGSEPVTGSETEPIGEDSLGRYHIYQAMGNITLDGKATDDEAWSAVQWTDFKKEPTYASGNGTVQAGFLARMKVLWQKDSEKAYLYFLIETNDATDSFGMSGWPYDYFKIYVDEDANGTNETKPSARYLGKDVFDDQIEYKVDDHRAEGKGYTVEAKYTFVNAANCAGVVLMEAQVHDFTGNAASGNGPYVRYAWKKQAGGDNPATGMGIISDIPVFAVRTMEGASVRVDTEEPNKSGIRFRTTVDAASIAKLQEMGATVTTGTLLLPTATLTDKGITEFTKANLLSAGLTEGKDFYDIVNVGNTWAEGTDGLFIGTLFGIKNFKRNFSAVGYARVELKDGTVYMLYGGYTPENARSVAEVARMALEDTSAVYTAAQREILENFISGGTQS